MEVGLITLDHIYYLISGIAFVISFGSGYSAGVTS